MADDPKLPDRMVEDFAGVEIDNGGREGEPFDFDTTESDDDEAC